jgi:hypothetical protein
MMGDSDYYASSSDNVVVYTPSNTTCHPLSKTCPSCSSHINMDIVYNICSFHNVFVATVEGAKNGLAKMGTYSQNYTNTEEPEEKKSCITARIEKVYKSKMAIPSKIQFSVPAKCRCREVRESSKVIILSPHKSLHGFANDDVHVISYSHMNRYDVERLLKRC